FLCFVVHKNTYDTVENIGQPNGQNRVESRICSSYRSYFHREDVGDGYQNAGCEMNSNSASIFPAGNSNSEYCENVSSKWIRSSLMFFYFVMNRFIRSFFALSVNKICQFTISHC